MNVLEIGCGWLSDKELAHTNANIFTLDIFSSFFGSQR
jgi:cyclopropane fatty-acyl-phospholipid synthase-like methyltransferase